MILHLLTNRFVNDSRVLRAARAGIEMGIPVTVMARHGDGLAEEEAIDGIQVKRLRLSSRGLPKRRAVQLIKYAELMGRMVNAASKLRPDLVHAHDLTTLPIGYAVARRTGAALLYDSHELWSSILGAGGPGSTILRPALLLERPLAKRADAVITVSESIALEMARKLGIGLPTVIRNIPNPPSGFDPATNAPSPLRRAFGISAATPVILYQGGMSPGRGLPVLLSAISHLQHPTALLVLLGDGPMAGELRKQVETTPGLASRVRFHPAVPQSELLHWTRGATLGVHPIEGDLLNHRLCLPNKLFEYIQAGLPVVVSDLPEMRRVVREYGLGDVFKPSDPRDLALKLDALLRDDVRRTTCQRSVLDAARALTWDQERERLVTVYQRLIRPAS